VVVDLSILRAAWKDVLLLLSRVKSLDPKNNRARMI